MKKGFTLIELLAVIVILAIILIIAVPRILEAINGSKISAMESSAKLIVRGAEQKQLEKNALGDSTAVTCTEVAEYNSNDYDTCTLTFNNGVASITLSGKTGGKFEGIECSGTKDTLACAEIVPKEWVYSFAAIDNASQGSENFSQVRGGRVFIRYNKNDMTEKYVCITYNMTNNEPICLTANAYNTRNEENSEWSKLVTAFGSSNCGNYSNGVHCDINTNVHWGCEMYATSGNCSWANTNSYYTCDINTSGYANCTS